MFRVLSLSVAALLLTSGQDAFAFGGKKMHLAEVNGVSETQVVNADGKSLSVMVRGRAAELLFRTIKEKRKEQMSSAALDLLGGAETTHWKVEGRQISCSRLAKGKTSEYACAFALEAAGKVVASREAFDPDRFNLPLTKAYASLFKKPSGGRGLASVGSAGPNSPVVFEKAKAYVLYEDAKRKQEAREALLVIRGQAASEIREFLTASGPYVTMQRGSAKGIKAREISCVEATVNEGDRCALVISLGDGAVSTRNNPLF